MCVCVLVRVVSQRLETTHARTHTYAYTTGRRAVFGFSLANYRTLDWKLNAHMCATHVSVGWSAPLKCASEPVCVCVFFFMCGAWETRPACNFGAERMMANVLAICVPGQWKIRRLIELCSAPGSKPQTHFPLLTSDLAGSLWPAYRMQCTIAAAISQKSQIKNRIHV